MIGHYLRSLFKEKGIKVKDAAPLLGYNTEAGSNSLSNKFGKNLFNLKDILCACELTNQKLAVIGQDNQIEYEIKPEEFIPADLLDKIRNYRKKLDTIPGQQKLIFDAQNQITGVEEDKESEEILPQPENREEYTSQEKPDKPNATLDVRPGLPLDKYSRHAQNDEWDIAIIGDKDVVEQCAEHLQVFLASCPTSAELMEQLQFMAQLLPVRLYPFKKPK